MTAVSGQRNDAVDAHLQALGAVFDRGERRRIDARHKHLRADPLQHREQCCAPLRIEKGGDIIEQDDGLKAVHRRDEPRVRQHEPDEKRLALAGGRARGENLFLRMQ